MDAIILCGGAGTRLASVVSDVPKSLAPIAGRPFLDYLLTYLAGSGIVSRVILATGHMAEQVSDRYGSAFGKLPVVYSREETSLGTGGAVLLALRNHGVTSPCLVLNGDSFIDADLAALTALLGSPETSFAMALYETNDAARFGTVDLSANRVVGFLEKAGRAERGLINAGVYAIKPEALADWATRIGAVSMERDLLPCLVERNAVRGLQSGSRFIDIGLPETYRDAPLFFQDKATR